mmetsp:Transcript_18763/g.26461  ORF Transcript_18763/g.26461 Transcript_18763/m.26461 type:complete len:557 (+) Transcript_18763:393-2063(+)
MGKQVRKSKRNLATTSSHRQSRIKSDALKISEDDSTFVGSPGSSVSTDPVLERTALCSADCSISKQRNPMNHQESRGNGGAPSSTLMLSSSMAGSPCTCQNIQGNEQEIDLFLPKCLPCICRLHLQALEEGRSSNPKKVALKNIVRPWQAEFLASVGIERVSELGRAYKNHSKDLAKCLRRWCRKNNVTCQTKEASMYAIHIWARTCRNVKQIVSAENFADMISSNDTNDTTTVTRPVSSESKPISPQDIPALSKLSHNFFKNAQNHPSPTDVMDLNQNHFGFESPSAPEGLSPDDEWWQIQPKIEQQLRELEEFEQRRQRQLAMEQALTFENTRWEELAHEAPELHSKSQSDLNFRLSQSEPRGSRRGASFRGLYKKVIDNLAEEETNAEEYSIYKKISPTAQGEKSRSNRSLSLSDHFQRTSSKNMNFAMNKDTISQSGRSESTRTTVLTSSTQITDNSLHNSDSLLEIKENTLMDDFNETDDDNSTDYDFALMANQDQKSLFTKGRRRVHEEWEDHNDEIIQGELAEPLQLAEKRRIHPWDFSQSKRVLQVDD